MFVQERLTAHSPGITEKTLQNYSAHNAKSGTDLSLETILLGCIQDSDSQILPIHSKKSPQK